MAFDIYGQHLQRGHCEVHPWVHSEYPCPVCLSESDKRRREKEDEKKMWKDMEEAEWKSYADNIANMDGGGI